MNKMKSRKIMEKYAINGYNKETRFLSEEKTERCTFWLSKKYTFLFLSHLYKVAFLYTPALYLNDDNGIFTFLAASEVESFLAFHF